MKQALENREIIKVPNLAPQTQQRTSIVAFCSFITSYAFKNSGQRDLQVSCVNVTYFSKLRLFAYLQMPWLIVITRSVQHG